MNDNSLLKTLIEKYSLNNTVESLALFKKLGITSVFDISGLTEADFKDRVSNAIKKPDDALEVALKEDFSKVRLGQLYDNAKCLAAQISQLYREKQSSGGTIQDHWHLHGIRGLKGHGPTYTNLFKENWNDACKVDSISAIDSPVAYLRALYRYAHQLESSISTDVGDKASRILLKDRRPDLAMLSIDQQSTFTAQPMLKIVNDILDTNIQEALKTTSDKRKTTYEVLAQHRYPLTLPYEFFHHQCMLGLSGKKPALGELNYLISNDLPITASVNSPYGKVLESTADAARLLMSGMGPKQQELLTEVPRNEEQPHFPPAQHQQDNDYWINNVGIASFLDLKDVNTLLKRTGLHAEQLEALIAQGKYTPRQSSHYRLPNPFTTPFGARYVNGTAPNASMNLSRIGKNQKINEANEYRIDRLHRMIRLQRWLGIPFGALDTLICSIFESQHPRNTSMQPDRHTVRSLGVYRYLNRLYSVTAEEFAALLHRVSPSANGSDTSQLDRIFNQSQLFEKPLLLDGRQFRADLSDPESHSVLQHLSANLGLPQTEDSLLLAINNTQKYLGSLKCDLPTLSSIYRQARIARMFDISITDTMTLANWLGGESVRRCLVKGKDLDTSTLRIKVSHGKQHCELVAIIQLPEDADSSASLRLLSGSSLTNHSTWFPEGKAPYGLKLAANGDNAHLFISGIPTIAERQTHSLEGLVINVTAPSLYRLLHRKQLVAEITSTKSNGLDDDDIQFNATLTHDEPSINLMDVLMQMDWMTRWLNESALDIPMLRRFLVPTNSDDHSYQDLLPHLDKLHEDTKRCAVTPQELAKLYLPENIDWRAKLSETLLDDKGLVKDFAPSPDDDIPGKFDAALAIVVDALTLDTNPDKDLKLKVDCKKKLKALLLSAHDRQLHLMEKFLQETSSLPMNRGKGVVIWSGSSVYRILSAAIQDQYSLSLPQVMHPILRHAEASVQLRLSNKTLCLFLKHPEWLRKTTSPLRMTIDSLYFLDRFNHCIDTNYVSEESVLSYLELANNSASATTLNSLLARLLNWTTAEVTELSAKLESGKAQTLQAIDWIMRCQNTCKSTGLSAQALLKATALSNESPENAWKTVGEAVMAASL